MNRYLLDYLKTKQDLTWLFWFKQQMQTKNSRLSISQFKN